MLKPFAIAAACVGGLLATDAHAGFRLTPPLPDFPPHARPGECWARVPAGHASVPHKTGSQSVWTLERGAGPGAVWSRSERPVQGGGRAGHAGPWTWAQVDCDGRPGRQEPHGPGLVMRPPPLPPEPPHSAHAGAPALHPGARDHDAVGPHPRRFEHHGHAPEPNAHGGDMHAHDGEPHAHGREAHPHHGGPHLPPPPAHYGAPHSPPMTAPFGPMHPPHFAPRRLERQPVAPWFGGRYLTWPGKALR